MSAQTRHQPPRPPFRPSCQRTARWVLSGLVLAGLVAGGSGCSSSTDPGPGPGGATITFTPEAQGQDVLLSGSLEFRAAVSPAGPLDVAWSRQGQVVGDGSTYVFVPSAVGPDTLRVRAESGSTVREYYWVITVGEDPSAIPPEVPNVVVGPGPLPSEVAVSWNRVPPGTVYPIVEYLVAFSHDGPITMENWGDANQFEPVPHLPGSVGYSVVPDSTDGLRPGQRAWFAVRARDDRDQLSNWTRDFSTVVTWPWWVAGQVILDDGSAAPPGIIVESLQPRFSDNTDGQGNFRLGPFRSIDGVQVKTTSSNAEPGGWYDYRSDDLTYESEDLGIVLIGRHGVDPLCRPELINPEGDFLKYMRWMTLTQFDPEVEKGTILNRWEEFPLSVHVPDFTTGGGLDMGAAAALAPDIWNVEMGDVYFVTAPDSASADVVFRFEPLQGADGRTSLLLPAWDVDLKGPWPGRVVPEKLLVRLDDDSFPTAQSVTEVALHELGHVLGIWSHAVGGTCNEAGYLMALSASGALDNPEPIHRDERNMVRAIRHLPQGVDFERYLPSR